MHGLMFEKPKRGATTALAPESGQCRTSHLNNTSLLSPFHHSAQVFAQYRIALRMSDDRRDTDVAELEHCVGRMLRNPVVAEFHQQITRSFDHVTRGIGESVLNVLVGKVKVAAE